MALSMRVLFMLAATLIAVLSAAPASAAGRGHGGGGTTTGSSLTLVLVNSSDGVPHWGQQITFSVSTTATSEPRVAVRCSQNGVLVYSAETGYYASYPWPWTQIMTLSSPSWTGGAADCAGTLYYYSGTKTVTLSTLNFHVYA